MKKLILGIALAAIAAALAIGSATAAAPKGAAPKAGSSKLAKLAIGDKVPDFSLKGIDGKTYKLSSLTSAGKVVVLEWYNPLCPAVHKYRLDCSWMNDTSARLDSKKVVWLSINSGAPGKEGSGLDASKDGAAKMKMTVPILLDEDGKVGRAYGATCTPTIYVIDGKQKLQYHGAPDETSPLDKAPKGTNYIVAAVEAVLKGQKPTVQETKAFGCSVKYSD